MEEELYDVTTPFERYQVVDMPYVGRQARVLFSGKRGAAQSGIPLDNNPDMLFDYNQRFLELIESIQPSKILLIGGGAFTLPIKVTEEFPSIEIDVVEQDPELERIAERFFNLKPSKNLNIIIGDGRKYLDSTRKRYDLILLDAYVHSSMPKNLSTKEFIELLAKHLSKNGAAAVNVISAYHGPNDTVLKQTYATYKTGFSQIDIFPADKVLSYWISQNFVMVATKGTDRPPYQLRFESLKPPPASLKDILHD